MDFSDCRHHKNVKDNYDEVEKYINKQLSIIYKDMNDYFENIITAPSTINRIFKYYTIGLPSDPTVNERYLMFGGTIVRKYDIFSSALDIALQKQLREIHERIEALDMVDIPKSNIPKVKKIIYEIQNEMLEYKKARIEYLPWSKVMYYICCIDCELINND